tara:strand:- start:217 stop:864 length:648 start_codon:yes stop_codon:yes gene_type:complete
MLNINSHFFISGILSIILLLIYFNIKNHKSLYNLLKITLIVNFSTFYLSLFYLDIFDYKIHLPIHLCYLTELGILISLILKIKNFYPLLALNSLGGGITGFTNSNLMKNAHFIEHTHLYLSHFNLLFFFVIVYKEKLFISKHNFIKSIILNGLLFFIAFIFNYFFNSNYWFTRHRPPGMNLTNLLPEWPYYLLGLIIIGLGSYYLTFRLLYKNKV